MYVILIHVKHDSQTPVDKPWILRDDIYDSKYRQREATQNT